MECLSCGCPDFELVAEPFLVVIAGNDIWMKADCWGCVICGEVLMDTEQMDVFLKRYREYADDQKRSLQEKAEP